MGNGASELHVASIPDAYVAVSICSFSKIRVMNATPDVKDMLIRLDQEITSKCGISRGPLIDYYGTLKMKVGDKFTFYQYNGKNRATIGKYFALRLLEEMHNLGYNLLISSDLARQADNATWYFAKGKGPGGYQSTAKICCIAPGGAGHSRAGNNKLVLLHHDENIKQAVMLALGDAWPNGVSSTKDVVASGEHLHEIHLNGIWGWTHKDGINTRRTICNLVGRMGGLNWRLLASSNLKGTADSYFFIYDPTYTAHPDDFCMLTLAKLDRFRLINCNHLLEPLQSAITSVGLSIQEKLDYYGCHEIKVHGTPWRSSDNEAIAARRSISRTMEVFGQHGYTPLYAIDISRRLTDKTSILFRKNPRATNCKYACLSLTSVDRLRLLDFPIDVGVAMRDALYKFYPMGVRNEVQLPDSNLEINVNDWPWIARIRSSKGGAQYHMRAALGKMMAIAAQYSWYVSISADVSAKISGGKHKHPLDVHSIYFVKIQ
ncbi:hypothetical protein ACHWQZ_G000402 [Mnemiopsis leidyi]